MASKLFVTGNGYSGSGCILDWLREQKDVNVLPVRPFQYKLGRLGEVSLQKYIVDTQRAQNPKDKQKVLVNTLEHLYSIERRSYFTNLYQLRLTTTTIIRDILETIGIAKFNPEVKSRIQGANEVKFDIAFLEEVLSQYNEYGGISDSIWSDWIDNKIASLYASPASVHAIDKSVPLKSVEDAEYFMDGLGSVKIIVALRDPVDQICEDYIAIMRKNKLRLKLSRSPLGVIVRKSLVSKLEKLEVLLQLESRRPKQIHIVYFEEFVNDHIAQTQRISDWAGFTPFLGPYRHLDLKVSRQNIGVGERYPEIIKFVKSHTYYKRIMNLRHSKYS